MLEVRKNSISHAKSPREAGTIFCSIPARNTMQCRRPIKNTNPHPVVHRTLLIYSILYNSSATAAANPKAVMTVSRGMFCVAKDVVPQQCPLYVTLFAMAATSNTEPFIGLP